ncbi:MAG: CHRD domain-containing protein [Acidimicrobiales bacterium]|nr:CHRD domain-containing protein [Acidimicrobiales bacterium]
MRKITSAIAAAGAAALLFAAPASAAHEGSSYTADLQELNDSGASGTATVTVSEDGETMSVRIQASGLALDGPHAQHIHGIVSGDEVSASACPTMADAGDDGVLTVAEGLPSYGDVQVSLTTEGDSTPDSALAVERFPGGTSIDYSRTGIPIPDALKPNLGKLHIVVHGIDENGNGMLDMDQEERSSLDESLPREATAPALCGTLAAQAQGPVQTGAGGTAEVASDGAARTGATVAGIAAVGFAALAFGTRRRTA